MDGKASDWRPGPTVCRCCLTEGCYKDISTEYFWMGKREVYAEMLSETLNLSIAYSKSGGPNSNSRLICEPCISRLRDASEFKRQVIDCEKTFMNHLDPGSSSKSREFSVDNLGEVKVEVVKREKESLSDDDFDDQPDFLDVDTDDDLDDQPLTKLASKLPGKVPKKESVELLDLLDTSQITVKRKSTLKLKAPPKKIVKKKEVKPTASKPVPAKATEKKKETKSIVTARQNACTLLKYSTAYPFRLPESSMVCVYCAASYDDPAEFRTHHDQEHKDFNYAIATYHNKDLSDIKVDCTDLRCRICLKQCDNLEDMAKHLIAHHEKNINIDYHLGLLPFKINKDKYLCAVCNCKFANIRYLSKHTNTHFVKYTCESCGNSYSSATALNGHIRNSCSRKSKMPFCRKCRKSFSSLKERMNHMLSSNKCCQHVCNICYLRFPTWNIKQAHLKETHDKPVRTYPCPDCGVVFLKATKFREHFVLTHTDKHYPCGHCDQRFASEGYLKQHVLIHSGEKTFVCDVCDKSFLRKKGLSQHKWIHSEVKKHTCTYCDKHFNQRVCWKAHMRSRHPEQCDF